MWRQDKLGDRPARLIEEAAVRFLREAQGQRDYATKARHVKFWVSKLKGRTVGSLTSDDIADNLPSASSGKYTAGAPLAGATLNRYVATIKRMLNLCVEWDWIDKVPKMPSFEEPDVRVRWEPPGVIWALINELRLDWMRDAAIVAVATGLRESELFSLPPSQVMLEQGLAWITHSSAKSKRARSVPLNKDSLAVLTRRMQIPKKWVFTRGRKLVTQIKQHDRRDFERACQAVGIEDFHWHDLRHTWASWHVQKGTPLMVLKELGGWETIEMVKKYAHLAPNHIASHAHTINFWEESSPPVPHLNTSVAPVQTVNA